MKQLLFCILSAVSLFFFSCKKSGDTPKPVPPLNVSPTSITLKGNAGVIDSFSINFSGDWTVSVNPSTAGWLKLSSTSGTGNKKIYVTVEETYTSGSDRTATITAGPVNNAAQQKNIAVIQKPYEFSPWHNVYGGTERDEFAAAIPATDGGYIAVGSAMSNNGDVSVNHGDKDLWVVKVNEEGIKLWEKTFGGSGLDYGNAIIATPDGGYLIAGMTYSNNGDVTNNHGDSDAWLIKIDGNGNKLWQKTYGGESFDRAFSIIASDMGYLLVGITSSKDISGYHTLPGNSGQGDAWLISIDPTGNMLWQKPYGGTNSEVGYAAVNSSDGGYVVAGWTDAFIADGDVVPTIGRLDMWVLKVNASGGLLWQKNLGGTNIDLAFGIVATTDGGYIITGLYSTSVGFPGNENLGIMKIDGNGNIVWQKSIGGSGYDRGASIIAIPGGNFLIAGSTSSADGDVTTIHGASDAWIIKINNDGNIVWQKTWGGSANDLSNSIISIGNNKYMVAGMATSSDIDIVGQHGQDDAWLFTFKDQ